MTAKHKILSKDITPEQREIIKEQFPDAFNNGIDPSKFNLEFETISSTDVPDIPDILYHYTTMGTLQSILNNVKEKGTLILRGTHVEYLNDEKEFKLACEVMSEVIVDYEKHLPEIDKRDIAKYFTPEKWEQLAQTFRFGDIPFITSLSEEPDSLSMWNTYGDDGVGVAIGISKRYIKNSYEITKCIYDRERFKQDMMKYLVDDVYKSYFVKDEVFRYSPDGIKIDMLKAFSIYKHHAYEYEKEWRLIAMGNGFSSPMMVNFQERKGLLKPYIEHAFNKDALVEIIIGPCADKELAKNSLEMCLHRAGFSRFPEASNHVKVENSKVPFRQI